MKKMGFFLILFSFVLFGFGIYQTNIIQNMLGQKRYNEIAIIATHADAISKAPVAELNKATGGDAYVSPIDFEYLKSINPDVVGYVRIPGVNDYLEAGYPILWREGDNEYYLHRDIDGNKSAYGAIYLDSDCKPDFSSKHNITYGHHMKNGSMYRDIVKFKDEDFFNEHRDVYIYTPEKEYHLKTFACLYTDPDGIRRKTNFSSYSDLENYCNEMTKGCSFREMPEDGIKQLWSFVTCSYERNSNGQKDSRTILYCYEVED